MARRNQAKNEAIGLHIDGQQVQVAHLRWDGKQMVLLEVNSTTLPDRFDLEQTEDKGFVETPTSNPQDILGLGEDSQRERSGPSVNSDEQIQETNGEALFRVIDRMGVKGFNLGMSLMESSVIFLEFPKQEKLKGKKIEEWLLKESLKEQVFDETLDLAERHAYLEMAGDKWLSIIHEDPFQTLNVLDDLIPFIGRVRVKQVQPLEIALMNMVRYYPSEDEDEVVAIVYVGEHFSRVIFMAGGAFLAFSPPIHEGFRSHHVINTLASRILYELDGAHIPHIDRIVLTGGCKAIEADVFMAEHFPHTLVEYLEMPDLGMSDFGDLDEKVVSEFAVPISLAWKCLNPGEETFYPINFLPRARKKLQNPLEMAWHSVLILALLAGSLLFFGIRERDQNKTIAHLHFSLDLIERQMEENRALAAEVNQYQGQINEYHRRFAMIDSLQTNQVILSQRLKDISQAATGTKGVWLERVGTSRSDLNANVQVGG